MNKTKAWFEQFFITKELIYLSALAMPVAIVTGCLVAFFLWALDLVTVTRWQNLWLIYLMPVAGIFIYWLYKAYGKNSEKGNNLVIDEIHEPGEGIPARMTPLILFTTVLTHLVGGSAGREGTAVQMGGSMSALFSRWLKLEHKRRRLLLMAGMSAGFGAVFGTPIAGTIFAMEVLFIGKIKYDALLPCLLAGIIGNITCSFCGIHHTHYTINFVTATKFFSHFNFDLLLLTKTIIAGALFGLAGFFFSSLSHMIKNKSLHYIKTTWLIPVAGAILVIGISALLGTRDYLGLGVTNPNGKGVSIVSAFRMGGAGYLSWFWKLLLTAITLGMGFKGGEVTPLFFIGATLGNTLANITGSPVDLFAGLGFIAVFAGATNTPLACSIMGAELFGSDNIIFYAAACFAAYHFSGRSGIYGAQRTNSSKIRWDRRDKKQPQNSI